MYAAQVQTYHLLQQNNQTINKLATGTISHIHSRLVLHVLRDPVIKLAWPWQQDNLSRSLATIYSPWVGP